MSKGKNQLLATSFDGHYDTKSRELNSHLSNHNRVNNMTSNCQQPKETHANVDSYGHHNRGFLDSTKDLNDLSKNENILITDDNELDNISNNEQQSPILSIRSLSSSIIVNSDDSDVEVDGTTLANRQTLPSNSLTLNSNSLILNNNNNKNSNNKKLLELDKDAKLINEKIILNKNTNNGPTTAIMPQSIMGGLMQNLTTNNELTTSKTTATTTQQIGSIAVNNSSDITFGNKHFYEGPVTIQQFLIKNASKSSQIDENVDDDATQHSSSTNNIDIDKLNKTSANCCNDFMCLRLGHLGKYLIFGIICILIIIITLAITHGKDLFSGNIFLKAPCSYNETDLCLVKRSQWNARPVPLGSYVNLNVPVARVIIAHTVTEMCLNFEDCVQQVQKIQNFHMDVYEFAHIGYNFLIGGDGRAYEGRGWNMQGAHTKNANTNSLGVAFIGTFIDDIPNQLQLVAFEQLLVEGVHLEKLKANYRIYGAKQFTPTQSPGDALYKLIQTWERWENITKDAS